MGSWSWLGKAESRALQAKNFRGEVPSADDAEKSFHRRGAETQRNAENSLHRREQLSPQRTQRNASNEKSSHSARDFLLALPLRKPHERPERRCQKVRARATPSHGGLSDSLCVLCVLCGESCSRRLRGEAVVVCCSCCCPFRVPGPVSPRLIVGPFTFPLNGEHPRPPRRPLRPCQPRGARSNRDRRSLDR